MVTPAIPTEISKWIFLACIMVSFLLLVWDAMKARRILATRDISLAFTNVMTNRYLSMKDYRYFCLFRSIHSSSRKGIENYAFFIFFQLKGWKRLLLAEAPRQVINVVTLEALVPEWLKIRDGSVSFDNSVLGESWGQRILTGTMAFSVLVFALSFILVSVAAVLYIPLFCHIRGNLKEYCCHKVDKRIAALLRKQDMSKYGGSIRPNHIVPQTDMFMDKSDYYKRPLAANNMMGRNPPIFASPAIEEYEETSYFLRDQASSPMMSVPLSKQPHNKSTSEHHLPENFRHSKSIEGAAGSTSHHCSPKPVANQLPYQNRAYQYYPNTNSNRTATKPSSTCVNQQRYQFQNYSRDYQTP